MSIEVLNPSGTIKKIGWYRKWVRKRVGKALTKTTEELRQGVSENISLTDHSLFDLAQMGHPYAVRNYRPPHSPEYLIHEQSGNFKSALFKKIQIHEKMGALGGDIMVGIVGFDENACPHARFVIMGTSKMVSRDVLTETMNAKRDDLERTMKGLL
jgi:hypothetical protein